MSNAPLAAKVQLPDYKNSQSSNTLTSCVSNRSIMNFEEGNCILVVLYINHFIKNLIYIQIIIFLTINKVFLSMSLKVIEL